MQKRKSKVIDPILEDVLESSGAWVMEEFEQALVGHTVSGNPRAVYDVKRMIAVLQERESWSEQECWEWLEYNTFPTFHPNQQIHAPIFLYNFESYDQPTKN